MVDNQKKNIKVLILEDDFDYAALVVNRLMSEGWKAGACYDSNNVYDMIEEHLPTIVVLDVMMPG